ncbi:MAG: ATP-binding protein [Pseudomonadota bacterium]
MNTGILTFFCGKMGAGKSTKAQELAKKDNAVLLSEDEWLSALYTDKIVTLQDYVKYSNQLKPPIKKLVQSILTCSTNVVMDFPANTVLQRQWFHGIFSEIRASHRLVFIDCSDAVCLEQIAKRREEQPNRASTDTEAMFEMVTKHFVPPSKEEGFTVIKI